MDEEKRKEMVESRRKAKAQMILLQAFTERFYGIKVLIAYRCLFCARVFDEMDEAVQHYQDCEEHAKIQRREV